MTGALAFLAIAVAWEVSAWLRKERAHRLRMRRIELLLQASTQDMKLASEILKSAREDES